MATNLYQKGVSNRDFGRGGSKTDQNKLLDPVAREHPDHVNSNNELKQYQGGASGIKSMKLGKQGRDF